MPRTHAIDYVATAIVCGCVFERTPNAHGVVDQWGWLFGAPNEVRETGRGQRIAKNMESAQWFSNQEQCAENFLRVHGYLNE